MVDVIVEIAGIGVFGAGSAFVRSGISVLGLSAGRAFLFIPVVYLGGAADWSAEILHLIHDR